MLAIEELKKLTLDNFPLLTVVSGEDVGQYSQLKEALLTKINYNSNDLNFSYFDLSEGDFQSVLIDLESLSFFGDDKFIILDHVVDLTTDKKAYLDEKALKQLESYLENPIETTHLIIFAPGKLDGKRRIVKLLKRDASVYEGNNLKPQELMTYFKKELYRLGLSCSDVVFEQLLLKSNFSFSEVSKNLLFLKEYKQSGEITVSDIEVVIPKTLQDNVFDLTRYLLEGNTDAAMTLVHDLRLQKKDDLQFLAIILSQMRLLLQLKLLSEKGVSMSSLPYELGNYIGKNLNPYHIKYALKDAQQVSTTFLKDSIQQLISCDYAIKRGENDKSYLFDVTLLKIMAQNRMMDKK